MIKELFSWSTINELHASILSLGKRIRIASLLRHDNTTVAAALAGDHKLTGLAQLHRRAPQTPHHRPESEYEKLSEVGQNAKLRRSLTW